MKFKVSRWRTNTPLNFLVSLIIYARVLKDINKSCVLNIEKSHNKRMKLCYYNFNL